LKIRLTAKALVHDGMPFGVGQPPLVETQLTAEADTELVPPGSPTVLLIEDNARADAMRKAVEVRDCRVWGGLLLQATIVTHAPPVPLVVRPLVRANGKEWPAGGPITIPAGQDRTHGFSLDLAEPIGERVDVVLSPDLGAAENDHALSEVWAREIVIRDVKVIHAKQPTTKPSPRRIR
jgi:hypothetical protein